MDYENLDTLRCAMEITPQQVVSPYQHDFSSKADARRSLLFHRMYEGSASKVRVLREEPYILLDEPYLTP